VVALKSSLRYYFVEYPLTVLGVTFYWRKLLVDLFLHFRVKMSMSLCNPCSKRYKTEAAVMLCEDCNEGFCTRCLNVHKSNPEFVLHRITEFGCIRGCEVADTKFKITQKRRLRADNSSCY
jgi:hypothetical protein